jgi:hypothetical protein
MHRCTRLLLMAPLVVTISCLGNMDGKCEEKSVREVPSPSGILKAVEYHTTCEGWYTGTIEIAKPDNSNRATAMHARPVSQARPPVWPELKVEWKSDKELWITYPPGVDTTCVSSPPGVAVHCLDASIVR